MDVYRDWPEFEKLLDGIEKYLELQYAERPEYYDIFTTDGVVVYRCTIYKAGYKSGAEQANHDTWRADFEANYKSAANQRMGLVKKIGQPMGDEIRPTGGKDPSDNAIPLHFTADGRLKVTDRSSWISIITGEFDGITNRSIFARAEPPDDDRMLFSLGGYTEQTSEARRSVASTDDDDTATGSGARKVELVYLNEAGAEFSEVIPLNGTNAVDTVATDIMLVRNFHVIEAGSDYYAKGDIVLMSETGGGGSEITKILEDENTWLTAINHVPAGKMFITTEVHVYSGHNKKGDIILVNERDFTAQGGGFVREQHLVTMDKGGNDDDQLVIPINLITDAMGTFRVDHDGTKKDKKIALLIKGIEVDAA